MTTASAKNRAQQAGAAEGPLAPQPTLKLCYLLWPREPLSPAERRARLLERVAPALLAAPICYLQIDIDDDLAQVPSPAPKPPFSTPCVALVNLWIEQVEQRAPVVERVEEILRGSGFAVSGYLVDEQLYTEYGENPHATRRDWGDGTRSPGVIMVTLLKRPRWLAKEEWMRRWFGRQSPLSEAMQPRARYVRNVVLEALTPDAPSYEGIVEEAFPSPRHVTDPYLFYGARNAIELAGNMARMLASVASFLTLWDITTVTMSEYFLKTPFAPEHGVLASTPADLAPAQRARARGPEPLRG
jgi:hypothetical protein